MNRRADHVVIDAKTQPPVARCERCGVTVQIPLPISLDVLAAMANAFVKEHRGCIPHTAFSEPKATAP